MEYKIGQILTLKKDITVKLALSEKEVVIPKGSKVIIGADGLAHYIRDGKIQSLSEDSKVEEYDAAGLAEYIFLHIRTFFPFDEILEEYDITEKEFIGEIEYALDDIGLC